MADEQTQRRLAEFIAGADIRYPMPDAEPHALAGTFAPGFVADFLHTGRPVFLDLADRPDLREVARDWEGRVDLHGAEVDERPADAMLIRPDGYIAWAATVDEPNAVAALELRDSLSHWFGAAPALRLP